MSRMTCTDWRLGLSPVIWPSIRDVSERPRGGTDCSSRKCQMPNGTVRRYTICRVPRHPYPRLRIYDDAKMVASMTVPSFEWGQRHVDKLIGGGHSLRGFGRRRR